MGKIIGLTFPLPAQANVPHSEKPAENAQPDEEAADTEEAPKRPKSKEPKQ